MKSTFDKNAEKFVNLMVEKDVYKRQVIIVTVAELANMVLKYPFSFKLLYCFNPLSSIRYMAFSLSLIHI